LNSAAPGDVIELKAGAIFTGNFTLPEKRGDAWVTIRPSAEVALPPQGLRITPGASPSLPQIITPNADARVSVHVLMSCLLVVSSSRGSPGAGDARMVPWTHGLAQPS